MDIVSALKLEEVKLQKQLTAVQAAISALNGSHKTAVTTDHGSSPSKRGGRRRLSAAGRARIIQATKARWARIRAEKAKKAK